MAFEVTIGLCQIKVTDDIKENCKKAGEMIAQAYDEGCMIAVLPEMFCCPYDISLFNKYAQPEGRGEVYDFLASSAEKYKMVLIGGSVPEKAYNGALYNTCQVFGENGNLLGKHRKIHLFDVDIKDGISFHESEVLTAGNTITVINTNIINVGIGICYDVRFPELSRAMVLGGAQLLVFPGAFNHITGPLHWELLMRARALDNQVYVAGVAPALNPDSSYKSHGHSLLADPWGQVVFSAESDEVFLSGILKMNEVYRVRNEIPVLRQRRPKLYGKSN